MVFTGDFGLGGAGPPADDASCLEALRHKLGVVNPRFDLAEDID